MTYRATLMDEAEAIVNNYSMRSHLTITFAIMAMIPILILGGFQVSQITNITKESNENQKQTTYRLADTVQDYMYYHRNAVETLAATISASDSAFRTRESLTLKVQSLQENLAGFSGIYVVNDQSKIKAMNFTADSSLIGADLSDRDYTKRVQATQKTIVSSLFRGPEGANQPTVAIAAPIYDGSKRFDGFVLAVLDLAPIKTLVTKYDYGTETYPVVLDHTRKPVYHPNGALTDSLTDLSQEPVVADAKSKDKGEGTYQLSRSPQKEFITYASIADIDWIVWVSRSKEAVNAAFISSLKITLLLLIITLIVTVMLGSYLAKRLNGTIHALVGYTQRLAGGTFVKPDSGAVPRGAPLELQMLADHFFLMAGQIKGNQQALMQMNAELESRVEERTQRLLRKNQELEIVNTLLIPPIAERTTDEHIGLGILQLSKFIQADVSLKLNPLGGTSSLGGFTGWEEKVVSSDTTLNKFEAEFNVPVLAGSLLLGEIIVQHEQEAADDRDSNRAFLQTFANTIAIMMQNDLLLRSTQDEHATLNAVLESMSDAVVLIDVEHRVVYANHRMSDIFDIPMADLLRMSEEGLFHTISSLLSERQEDLQKLTLEPSTQGAFTLKQENGKERFMMVSAFQVSREDRVFGRGYVWRDMTKEHEIDALKNDLISLASHEFKTPITSIRGGVETLLRVDANWEESFKQELLEGIHEDIGRIQDLIDEWLDISKIESGAMRINPQPLRVDTVVESARRRLPQQASYELMRLDVQIDDHIPLIYADKLRMEQVLVNLFTNAVRYNDNQPLIKVTAKADQHYVHLEIQDNGIGIPDEHVGKIFDRFYRVDVSSSRQTGGTGLGLAICKGIMEAHGGLIRVESMRGAGSAFIISIPRFQGKESD
ncbi:PAS domain-containing protein [Paenibacillus sp. SYP-B3998]|uniref:histidine kinase n=1 Tax=Paenibacillus sp. SYP-B3998 TaxID=2678564 RepID=A0A6G4A4N5_9BACL|nr:ATP-binding protein [Paenibacillus sp. SYP-B3998]NEW09290.1 PAS domain-containing protein [Paenibacillus sp. SYP-B3998]